MFTKTLQRILAVTVLATFLSTSFAMGVSEAASVHRSSDREVRQHQRIHPEKRKEHKKHQAKPVIHKHKDEHRRYEPRRQSPRSARHGYYKKSKRNKDLANAVVIGGIIGAVIAKNT